MSKTVEVPHSHELRFPAKCVCCLQEAGEWRDTRVVRPVNLKSDLGAGQIMIIQSSVELNVPQIPYCRDHAKELDAHLTWQRAYSEYMIQRWPDWLQALVVLVPALVFGFLTVAIGIRQNLFTRYLTAIPAGIVVGIIVTGMLIFLLNRISERAVEKRLRNAGEPVRRRGAQFKFHPSVFALKPHEQGIRQDVGGALGLNIRVNPRLKGRVEVEVESILLEFQNPEYAALFRETNRLPDR